MHAGLFNLNLYTLFRRKIRSHLGASVLITSHAMYDTLLASSISPVDSHSIGKPSLVLKKFCKIFQIFRHIESLGTCMKH